MGTEYGLGLKVIKGGEGAERKKEKEVNLLVGEKFTIRFLSRSVPFHVQTTLNEAFNSTNPEF